MRPEETIILIVIAFWIIVAIVFGVKAHMDFQKAEQTEEANVLFKKWMWLCECGHHKDTHKGSSGPNSGGRYHHGECTHGSKSFPPYRIGGCDCYTYKRLFFPRYRRVTT